jgi:hypothetical protein
MFYYQKGKKCAKPVQECGFSHEFDATGLQNHVKLHNLDPTKFGLPAPPPSAGVQIIHPILRAVDCRDCGLTHVPGKCRRKGNSFSGLAHAVNRDESAARELNRFGPLINEHAGQDGNRSD